MGVSVFIDESGDTGIKSIRGDGTFGSSPYFVMAAAVMQSATSLHARTVLQEVERRIPRKWNHATDLEHAQKVYFARQAATINLRYFAVLSNKRTLGDYASEINWKPHKFFNKCAHYLLECVGSYLVANGFASSAPDVYFEDRNHDFDTLIRYIGKIKSNPLHERATNLSVFNPFAFFTRKKKDEALLKYADLAAHSVYQVANKSESNYGIPETRYLSEMAKKFGCDQSGRVLGTGLKCIHSIDQLQLDPDVVEFLGRLRANPRR